MVDSGVDEFNTTIAEPASRSRRDEELELEPGDTLGRYIVSGRLGAGGMGVVYRARDPKLDRDVALKLLRFGGMSPDEGQARLLREARALARLSHPNVLPVYDVGTTDRSLYLALELVEGQTLRQWWTSEAPGVDEIIERFSQAGRGLAAAHEADLIHRDFKPDNVLVGNDGRLRVMDFGLVLEAFHAPPNTDDDTQTDSDASQLDRALTEVGTVMGTPGYMAPEQHRADPLGPACDQYAFCVSLFEVLYGARPFLGATLPELTRNKRRMRIEKGPLLERVPERIAAALRRGLAVAPADRWPSMDELLQAIAPPPRRRWPLMLGATLTLCAGAIALGTLLPHSGPSCDATTRLAGVWDDATRASVRTSILSTSVTYAEDTWARIEPVLDGQAEQWHRQYETSCAAGEATERDRQIACLGARRDELGAMVELLASTDAQVVSKAITAVVELGAPQDCAQDGPAQPMDGPTAGRVATVRQQLFEIRALTRAGHEDRATSLAATAVEQARATKFEPVITQALLTQGRTLMQGHDPSTAAAPLEEAYWAATSTSDDTTATVIATSLVNLFGGTLMRFDDAEPWIEHAWTALDRAPSDPLRKARLLSAVGNAYFRQQRFDEAADARSEAIALFRDAPGDNRHDIAGNLSNLGSARFIQGDRDQAKACFDEALTLLEQLYGPRHPALTTAIMNTGNLAANDGDVDGAIAAYHRVIALVEDNLGKEHEKLAGPLNNLGFALLQRGDHAQARTYLHRAIAIWERVLGPDHPNIALALTNLANRDLEEGKYDEARVGLERALRILEAAMGERSPPTLESAALLGWALLGLGRTDEGLERLREVSRQADDDAIPMSLRAGLHAILASAYWDPIPTLAVEHGQQALSLFESLPSGRAADIEQIKVWLSEHPRPSAAAVEP